MERFTDAAQGYCEMYCKKYGHCFGDPGDCVFKDEVKMYEALKGYEFTGMSPADIRITAISAIREQEERRWIPVTERLPEKDGQYLCNYHFGNHLDMTFTSVLDYYATDSVPHFQHTLGDTTMKVTHWMPLPEPPKGD